MMICNTVGTGRQQEMDIVQRRIEQRVDLNRDRSQIGLGDFEWLACAVRSDSRIPAAAVGTAAFTPRGLRLPMVMVCVL